MKLIQKEKRKTDRQTYFNIPLREKCVTKEINLEKRPNYKIVLNLLRIQEIN